MIPRRVAIGDGAEDVEVGGEAGKEDLAEVGLVVDSSVLADSDAVIADVSC
jgi:hypothetical protein